MKTKNQLNLSWKEFEKNIRMLVNKIPSQKFDKILVITKGGLVPAYYLSKFLFIDRIETFNISSYKDRKQGELVNLEESKKDDQTGWLIIDDLVDSGMTAEVVKSLYPNAKLATLYKKPNSTVTPDYFVAETDKWVVFPWEQ